MFLQSNQRLVQWVVNLTETKVDDGLAAIYSRVVSDAILFDVFFEFACSLWEDPNKLVSITNSTCQALRIDDKGFVDRIRERIKRRRQGILPSNSDFDEPEDEAATAVITLVSALSNLAVIVTYLRQIK